MLEWAVEIPVDLVFELTKVVDRGDEPVMVLVPLP